ncbi:unnamed protein product [Mycena citricolor]|uniref:Uncharacterized protein n=1 Tax=Mycena citricolor TaxID=2018698 RepID=A0AAD2HUC2_9AGAR|nr:unnamed protein product [Mycena citricolor]CAK5281239.1 unnamed protein product [Mycena citricolor]
MSAPSAASRTPLSGGHHKSPSMSLPYSMVPTLNTRTRSRGTIFALISLVTLSAFVFYTQTDISFSHSYLRHRPISAHDQEHLLLNLEAVAAAHHGSPASGAKHKSAFTRPPLALTATQELGAVSAFIASLPQNVIPVGVDPQRPIDPQLILDFDTRSPYAMEEVDRIVEDVWLQNPVMVYGKLYSPLTREVKAMLNDLNLRPPPLYIDLDTRDDVEILAPMLTRLVGASDMPVVLVSGKPLGPIERVRELKADGGLQQLIKAAGAVIGGGGKRRKHH